MLYECRGERQKKVNSFNRTEEKALVGGRYH